MLDDEMVKGWDDFGIHCWSGYASPSIEFVEDNSDSIGLVERTIGCCLKKMQNFRKYLNRNGEERFIMLNADENGIYKNDCIVNIYITDAPFFGRFLKNMLENGEISKDDFNLLHDAINEKYDKNMDDATRIPLEPFLEEQCTRHSQKELDELEEI